MANVIKFESLEIGVLIGMANESAELVEASAKKAVEHAERCGRALNAIKAKLPHGEWGAWLGKNFDYSQRHAARYMTIASNWTRVSNLEGDGSIREALRMIADDPDTPKRECKPAVEVIEVAAEIVAVDMPAVEVITAVATVKPAKKRAAAEPDVISKTFATLSPQKKMAELRKLSADPDVMRIRGEKQDVQCKQGNSESVIEAALVFAGEAHHALHKYGRLHGNFSWLGKALKTEDGTSDVLAIIRVLDSVAIDAAAYSKTLNEKTRVNRGDD